ncbi:MAG: adenylate kinase family protein [Candidatus Nanohaloarchaea archaeon]
MAKLSLLGITGAGKTTQASLIQQAYGIPRVTVGDLLRDNADVPLDADKQTVPDGDNGIYRDAAAAPDDSYVQTVGDVCDRGENFPIPTLMEFLEPALRSRESYVLDGFPRTVSHVDGVNPLDYDAVIYLDVDDATARERVAKRGRSDDRDELFETKVSWQRSGAEDVMAVYRDRDDTDVYRVDGDSGRGPGEIFAADIKSIVDQYTAEVDI